MKTKNEKLGVTASELLAVLQDIQWSAEQRKMRGGKFLQRELNQLEMIDAIIKKATK